MGRLVEAELRFELLDELRVEALRAAIAGRGGVAGARRLRRLASARRNRRPPPEMREVAPESCPCSCAMMRSTGPPGANCTITKEMSMIPRMVGIMRRTRRAI